MLAISSFGNFCTLRKRRGNWKDGPLPLAIIKQGACSELSCILRGMKGVDSLAVGHAPDKHIRRFCGDLIFTSLSWAEVPMKTQMASSSGLPHQCHRRLSHSATAGLRARDQRFASHLECQTLPCQDIATMLVEERFNNKLVCRPSHHLHAWFSISVKWQLTWKCANGREHLPNARPSLLWGRTSFGSHLLFEYPNSSSVLESGFQLKDLPLHWCTSAHLLRRLPWEPWWEIDSLCPFPNKILSRVITILQHYVCKMVFIILLMLVTSSAFFLHLLGCVSILLESNLDNFTDLFTKSTSPENFANCQFIIVKLGDSMLGVNQRFDQ